MKFDGIRYSLWAPAFTASAFKTLDSPALPCFQKKIIALR